TDKRQNTLMKVVLVAILCTCACNAQEGASSPALREVLSKSLPAFEGGYMRLIDAFSISFDSAKTPAGLQVRRCGAQWNSLELPPHPTLKTVVEKISEFGTRSKIEMSTSGVINLCLIDESSPTLLTVRIKNLDIGLPQRNAMVAVATLLNSPEVRAASAS